MKILMLGAFGAGLMYGTTAIAGAIPSAATDGDFHQFPAELVELGRDLFFDPILSGNKNIACATCHHPSLGTSDGMSLSVGEGGVGLGESRRVDMGNAPKARIPRNAPALFNLRAKEYTVMFHDGRTSKDRHAMFGIRMPEGRTLEHPVVSALAAQNILPILSPDEMSGHPGENDVADAVAADRILGDGGAWDILTTRVDSIPEYRQRFDALGTSDIHITDIGKARCSTCHSGTFQTDHSFHAIGLPQIRPGKDDYASDAGRGMITQEQEDMYRFRTPTLRNVSMTGPYGHNGAYANLEDIVRHHLDAVQGLASYDRSKAVLADDVVAEDWKAMYDFDEVMRIAEAIDISDVALVEDDIAKIMSFLGALTDEGAGKRGLGTPNSVPSGLQMDATAPPS